MGRRPPARFDYRPGAGIAAVRNLAAGQPSAYGVIFVKLLTYNLNFNVLIYFLVAGFAYYLHSSRRLADRQRRTVELRAQLTEAQLDSLQRQLRPHFLFNALHTLSGLMVTDPRRGQRVVRQLGDLLRISLSAPERQIIPLAEEMEVALATLVLIVLAIGVYPEPWLQAVGAAMASLTGG